MTALELRTFGGVALLDTREPLDRSAVKRKPLALLVLLAGAGIQGLTRDKVMGYLWPETREDRGRNVLRQTVYALRRDLRAPDLLLSGATALRLNPDVVRTDLSAFREAVAAGAWATAAELYRGPFLDGFHLSDAPQFEEWVEGQRQDLEENLRRVLGRLALRAQQDGDRAAAAEWWRRLSRHDPLNSRVVVDLMNALEQAGEPGLALEAARSHAEVLQVELGTGLDASVAEATSRISARLSHPHSPMHPAATQALPPAAQVGPSDSGPEPSTESRSGARRGRTLAAAVAVVVLAGVTLKRPGVVPFYSAASPGEIRSVAVVPFADSSASREGRYLGGPLTEELARRLAGISALTVVIDRGSGRTSAPRADATLAGVVRADDGRLEISLRLSDASGRALWTRTHSGAASALPEVQSTLAREVAAALGAPITTAERRRIERVPTSDGGAYDLYLRSAGLSRINRVENLAGIALLHQAIRRDSSFAFALAMMARRFMFQAYLVDPVFADSGMVAVRRALAIDPDLGAAHFALGDLQGLAGQPSAARLSYLKAIDLDPAELPAMVDLSDVDASLGRYDEALYWALRAARLDPSSPGFRSHVVIALYLLGVDGATERWLLDAERRWPDYERFVISLSGSIMFAAGTRRRWTVYATSCRCIPATKRPRSHSRPTPH